MLTEFLACPGHTADLFWSLTPRMIEMHFAAARKRYRVERNMMMETAYLAAIVPQHKKPPKLKDLMVDVDEKPRRKQTAMEIKAALMLALGGPKKHG